MRAIQRACPFTVALEINSPCFKDFVPNRCTLYQGTYRRREIMNSGSAIGKCLCVRFSTCATLCAGGNHRGLPLQKGVFVGADPCICPNSHVEIISRRHLPIGQPKFVKALGNSDPLLEVPPAGRGNRVGARLGSPREAGGTLRRGANREPWTRRSVFAGIGDLL